MMAVVPQAKFDYDGMDRPASPCSSPPSQHSGAWLTTERREPQTFQSRDYQKGEYTPPLACFWEEWQQQQKRHDGQKAVRWRKFTCHPTLNDVLFLFQNHYLFFITPLPPSGDY